MIDSVRGIIKIAWLFNIIIWSPQTAYSQNYTDVGFFDFLSDNSIVVDSATGNLIDHHTVYNAFIHEWTDDSSSHYREILIDMYRKVSDGYEFSSLTENPILKNSTRSRVDSSNRDLSELIPFYLSHSGSSNRGEDAVYLFSRPRYYNPDEPKLYDYTELETGSYVLSNIIIQGEAQNLSDCFSKQIIDILPNSYAILHYGNRYPLECADSNSKFYEDVFGSDTTANTVKVAGRGPIKYILVEDYIYLFTTDKKFLSRLKLERLDSGIVLTGENYVRFEYTLTKAK
ncbi:hypothetical protein [Lewinella sp. JB7]|uniref:hypothetical protein n=1 Tax=Lewinella sp. JB7 TaxID=2962887 RepID=UPI0020CA1C6D|nr:hypothetical protein [Lewinella sp. JB7]MCP9237535.1 hypothetical protein [Lewinella sp. JB7]